MVIDKLLTGAEDTTGLCRGQTDFPCFITPAGFEDDRGAAYTIEPSEHYANGTCIAVLELWKTRPSHFPIVPCDVFISLCKTWTTKGFVFPPPSPASSTPSLSRLTNKKHRRKYAGQFNGV